MGLKKITKNMKTQTIQQVEITSEMRKHTNSEEVKTCDTLPQLSDRNITTEVEYFQKCHEDWYEIKFLPGSKDAKNESEEVKNQRLEVIINNFEPWKNVDKDKITMNN